MSSSKKKVRKIIKTRMGTYEVIFESNSPEKGYTVTVPKLKGVVTFGDTLADATQNVTEAIVLHCECLLDAGIGHVRPHKTLAKA